MAPNEWLTLLAVCAAILIITPILGSYIFSVMEGERVFLSPVIRPIERTVYRLCGIDETAEQGWKGYTVAVLVLAAVAIAAGYIVLRIQDILPLNPSHFAPMSPDLVLQHVGQLRDQHQLAELLR